jgi:hypothetical protein
MRNEDKPKEDEMVETRRIDSWVGQSVSLVFYGQGERSESKIGTPLVARTTQGMLVEVDNQGIILEAARGGEIFYGWNAIISIRPRPT